MATTVINGSLNSQQLQEIADEFLDFDDSLVVDDGQVCRKISINNRFIGLDMVAEVPGDFADPIKLVAMLEKFLDYPLVYDKYVIRAPIEVVATDVRTPTEHRLYVQSLGL